MNYYALATDYDGTLATHGAVEEETVAALERFRQSGRKLIMVTGRELEDLKVAFPRLDLFDQVVAENGALLYHPQKNEQTVLGHRPPDEFIHRLKERGVSPLYLGRVIISTWHPQENTVLEVIREMGLELQLIFNKQAVMILPSGLNKATGLRHAAEQMNLSLHNIVGVGDAENDHAFLRECAFSAAVANALPVLKEQVDWVSPSTHGKGVTELIEHLLASDLASLPVRNPARLILGEDSTGNQIGLPAQGVGVLLAGTSGSGKSTFATRLVEEMALQNYQFCIIDPEGDYQAGVGDAVVLGNNQSPPLIDVVLDLLSKPGRNAVVNLLGISMEERPAFFEKLLPRLLALRASTGRPHWILIDETHHLLPATWKNAAQTIPQSLSGFILITVYPDHLAREILALVDVILAIGKHPDETIHTFSNTLGEISPQVPASPLSHGEAFLWWRRPQREPVWLRGFPPREERIRHSRKYAAGEIPPEHSFYFRGPEEKINLRAQNLHFFLQIADGLDDETWTYHLKQGDYSRWFRAIIKDEILARETEEIEKNEHLDPRESRQRIRTAIEEKYTGAA